MARKKNLAFYLILSFLISSAVVTAFQPTLQSINPSNEVASNPSACPAGSFVTRVNETAAGGLDYTCTITQSEAISNPVACTAGNFLTRVTEAADGSLTFTCVAEGANEVASSPSACASGNFLSRVTEAADGSLTFTCVAEGTNEVGSSPNACGTGNYLTRIIENADGSLTFTCIALPQNTTPLFSDGEGQLVVSTTSYVDFVPQTTWTPKDMTSFSNFKLFAVATATPLASTVLQSVGDFCGTCSSKGKAYGSNVVIGNLLVAIIGGRRSQASCVGMPTATVADTRTSTWSSLTTTNVFDVAGFCQAAYLFYASAASSGADTVTVTWTNTMDNAGISILEVSGANTVKDTSQVGICTVSCGTSASTAALTFTTDPHEFIVSVLGGYPNTSCTAGAGFTLTTNAGNSPSYGCGEFATTGLNSPTTCPITFAGSGGNEWHEICASFTNTAVQTTFNFKLQYSLNSGSTWTDVSTSTLDIIDTIPVISYQESAFFGMAAGAKAVTLVRIQIKSNVGATLTVYKLGLVIQP